MLVFEPLEKPYKKELLKFKKKVEDQKKVFRIGVPNPKLSFLGSIYYGPKFMSLSSQKREEFLDNKLKEISNKLTPTSLFSIDNGSFGIKKLEEMMKIFHFAISNYIENEEKKEELESNNFNILFLKIILVLVPTQMIEESVLKPFREFAIDLVENSEKDSEVIYYELQKKYTELYKNILNYEFYSLKNIIQCSSEKKEKFLSILYDTIKNLFEFICFKTTEEFKLKILSSDEWLDVYDWFFLYQYLDGEYNILLVDATTMELWKDMNQIEYLDTDKKCVVILYFPDQRYECLFYSQTLPNLKKEYQFFNLSPNESFEAIKNKYRELAKENHPDRIRQELETEEDKEIRIQLQKKMEQWYDIQNNYEKIEKVKTTSFEKEYNRGTELDTSKNPNSIEESIYFFNYKHPFIQKLLE